MILSILTCERDTEYIFGDKHAHMELRLIRFHQKDFRDKSNRSDSSFAIFNLILFTIYTFLNISILCELCNSNFL